MREAGETVSRVFGFSLIRRESRDWVDPEFVGLVVRAWEPGEDATIDYLVAKVYGRGCSSLFILIVPRQRLGRGTKLPKYIPSKVVSRSSYDHIQMVILYIH
jgi:hypothetical protein